MEIETLDQKLNILLQNTVMATKELTKGNPYKLILLFMLPIFIGNAFQQMYMLADSLIVGRIIGLNALAAVGAAGPLIFLMISFAFSST